MIEKASLTAGSYVYYMSGDRIASGCIRDVILTEQGVRYNVSGGGCVRGKRGDELFESQQELIDYFYSKKQEKKDV